MNNDDIKGEVVKFARKMHFGGYKILIGKVKDINKTGHPLELIDDFKINKYENELIDFFLNGNVIYSLVI
jgi:hypothetical protein